MNVTGTAAASSAESPHGRCPRPATGNRTYSAWVPSRLNPRSPAVPHTARPRSHVGPCTTIPLKSRPGVRGKTVPSMAPATPLMSLGWTAAASTWTTASSSVACGIGRSTSSSTSGDPKRVYCRAFICRSLRAGTFAAIIGPPCTTRRAASDADRRWCNARRAGADGDASPPPPGCGGAFRGGDRSCHPVPTRSCCRR